MVKTHSKSNKILIKRNTVLLVLSVAFFASYVLASLYIAKNGFSVETLERKISEAAKENKELKLQLNQTGSLSELLELSDSLAYTEIQSISYIEKPRTPLLVDSSILSAR